jgi:hypothetical protein
LGRSGLSPVLKELFDCIPKIVQRIVAIWVGMWTKAESLAMHQNRLLNVSNTLTVFKEGIECNSKIVQGVVATWVGMWTKAESLAFHRNRLVNGRGDPVTRK